MAATFVVYVDESGCEGFSFAQGSSEWFVLSATITRKASDVATVKLVDTVRATLNKPLHKALHFRDLRHEHKLPFVDHIANADLKTISVLLHKPSIKEPETFRMRNKLYFYATRLLLERVSWYCREHKTASDAGDGSAEIIFSKRKDMSYAEMGEYFDLLKRTTGMFNVQIDWNVIRSDQLYAYSHGKRMGLQIADAVASSFFFATRTQYGFSEDRYVRMLKRVVYNHSGTYLGYGIKIWPKEAGQLIDNNDIFKWVREEYK